MDKGDESWKGSARELSWVISDWNLVDNENFFLEWYLIGLLSADYEDRHCYKIQITVIKAAATFLELLKIKCNLVIQISDNFQSFKRSYSLMNFKKTHYIITDC